MMRIVLLGASGFIGAALLREARDTPCRIDLLVHRRPPPPLPAGATSHRGTVTALPDTLWPDEPHVVIHCASKQIDRDGTGFDVNLQGVDHLCRQVTPHTRAVLFVSSCSVYGDGAQRGVREDEPLRPGTALARSRAACERRLARMARTSHCRVEVFRPRFVLGRGDAHVLPGLARMTLRGLTLGDGRQRFSVIDVDDLARVLLDRAKNALASSPSGFEAFNVGYERPVSLNEIHRVLRDRFAVPLPRRRIPVREGLLDALASLPVPPLQRLVHRVRLLGLDHHGDVSRLQAGLAAPWLSLDPEEALRHAARCLPSPDEFHRRTPA